MKAGGQDGPGGEGTGTPRQWFWCVVWLALVAPNAAFGQSREPTIESTKIGFESSVKLGYWVPIAVEIQAASVPFQGSLELETNDSDGLVTTLTVPDLQVGAGQSRTVHGSIRLGAIDGVVELRLVNQDGYNAATKSINLADPISGVDVLDAGELLFLVAGRPAGLLSAFEALDADETTSSVATAKAVDESDWPVRWFGYSSIQSVILTTSERDRFDRIDPVRANALATWVRQGGHLIVSVASQWQTVANSFAGPMLPARVTGQATLRDPKVIEAHASTSSERFELGRDGLPVARLEDVRGAVELQHEGMPLIVTGSYGLGKVTLLAFDVDAAPFNTWAGSRSFWTALLDIKPPQSAASDADTGLQAVRTPGISELATLVHQHLERFPDVKVVPFEWVAILIFVYMLLIGPVDYFLLKRVFGRLELTWITFPLWVTLVSVAAYYAAYYLKGNQQQINRLELVDVDLASSTLRGRSFFSLFSPRIAQHSFAVTGSLGCEDAWAALGMGRDQPDRVISWFGIDEASFRGMRSSGSMGLLGRRGYRYSVGVPETLLDVPGQVWSVKSFDAQWLAKAAPLVEVDLESDELSLFGTVRNLLDCPLEQVTVLNSERVYALRNLAPAGRPGDTVDLSAITPRALPGFLGQQMLWSNEPSASVSEDLDSLVRAIQFASKTPDSFRQYPSDYLNSLDLAGRLDQGDIILLAKVPKPAGTLWLDALPGSAGEAPPEIAGNVRTNTYLRILIRSKAKS